jgi:hypothetical protein
MYSASSKKKLVDVGLQRFGVPVGGVIGKTVGDALKMVDGAFSRVGLDKVATEVLHMTWVDMWVDALVAGEEWLSHRDLLLAEREWRLAGGVTHDLLEDKTTQFDMIWIEDHGEVMARYLRPLTQDFWLRVE